MKVCVIPAGGPQKRWTAPEPKNMTLIGGEPLLVRLNKQLEPYFDKIYILAWRPEILEVFPQALEPASLYIQQESLWATRDLWGDRTVVVYGDVVMSNAVRDDVVAFDGNIRFWGDYSEIIAYSWDSSLKSRVVTALEKAIKWTDRRWGFYRAFWNMPMAPVGHDGGAKEFTQITDGSTDVDEVACLLKVYEALKRWQE